jgi:Leucine-rich repeat (LRR) protein
MQKITLTIMVFFGGFSFVEAQIDKTYYNIEEALVSPEQVYSLYLNDKDLVDTSLVRIGELRYLRHLYIDWNNNITELPAGISKLTDLESLYINHCYELQIADRLGACKNLRKLTLKEIALKEYPLCINKLKNLEQLDLTDNEIETVPKSIGRLKKLQHLEMGSNRVTILPPNIRQLKKLKYLGLADNGLKEYPNIINELKGLEKLSLGRNDFEMTPVFSEKLTALKVVSLRSCDTLFFPLTLLKLPQLEYLDISYTPVMFPNTFGVQSSNLKTIDAIGCKLVTFPSILKDLTALEFLDLKKNEITFLPKTISAFEQLKKLDISQNKINEVAKNIVLDNSLKELDLSLNELSEMPNIATWTSLRKLKVGFCYLKELPKGLIALDSLQVADFKYNEIEARPKEVKQKMKGRMITVGNPLNVEQHRLGEQVQATKSTFVDPRDNQEYGTVTIDGATWLTEHLNYTTASSVVDTLRENNGRKYTLKEYSKVCPIGWHTAEEEDWRAIVRLVYQVYEKDPYAYENKETAYRRVPYGEVHEDRTVLFDPDRYNSFGYIGAFFVEKNQTEQLFKAPNVNFLGLGIRARLPSFKDRRRPRFMAVGFPCRSKEGTWNTFYIQCQTRRCHCKIIGADEEKLMRGAYFVRCVKDK